MTATPHPLITAVIPTYRRPRLLRRSIASVLEQSVDAAVCVYDNASGDETAAVVQGLAASNPSLRYYCHEQNLGPAANFEFGLSRVQTPYFSILSDDDYLLPGFYAEAVDALSKNPDAMFWAGVTLEVSDSGEIWNARVLRWQREGLYQPPEGLLAMLGGAAPTWTGIVFRREVLDSVGLPDRRALGPSDLDFVLKIAAKHPFLLRKIPAAVFSLNSESFSATQPLSSFWPGWQQMLANIGSNPDLDAGTRARALHALHADAKKMLFRRGASALHQARYDFARAAADALVSGYRAQGQAMVLRVLATLCASVPLIHRAYRFAYRVAERRIVDSRSALQQAHGNLLRPG